MIITYNPLFQCHTSKNVFALCCLLISIIIFIIIKYLIASFNMSSKIFFSFAPACLHCSTHFNFFLTIFVHTSLSSLFLEHFVTCSQFSVSNTHRKHYSNIAFGYVLNSVTMCVNSCNTFDGTWCATCKNILHSCANQFQILTMFVLNAF